MTEQSIVGLLRGAGRPLAFEEIAAKTGRARDLKGLLARMMKGGRLIRNRAGLYLPVEENLLSGYFEAHKGGFGFLIQERPGLRDIFIPADSTLSAMDGDKVVVRPATGWRGQRAAEGRPTGAVVRIIERANKTAAGTLEEDELGCYIRPKNKTMPVVFIPLDKRGGAKKGQSVVAEIEEYPGDRKPPSGRVVKIIEAPEGPKADVEAIVEEFGLPRRFPREAVHEARLLGPKDFGGRKDLRALRAVTIDGENAKDFDDAVSLSLEEQGYRLSVHIADVGFYVGWGSPIDIEARKRATSVYFPDRVIHMLPPELSENLCSLRPGEERPAFTAELLFDRQGRRQRAKFYPSLIRSAERLTYTAVAKAVVEGDANVRRRYEGLLGELELMAELCGVLRAGRLRRGSLDFDLPEPEVLLDLQGRPEAIVRAERNLAHMIIEEFMIAANEAVAEHLQSLGVPALYRIHEEPDPARLEALEALGALGTRGGAAFRANRGRGRAARPSARRPRAVINETLRAVKGRPEEEPVTYAILRSLKQARYSTENVGHFGLASDCYTHFTSPIRRYPDLVVHRILKEAVSKNGLPDKRIKELEGLLPDIAHVSSRMERVSEKAEREAVGAMRVWFMKDKVGEEFAGRIMDVTPYGLRVRLRDFLVEGFLHVSYLADDFYSFDRRGMTLRGRSKGKAYRLGQELTVRLDRVDIREREIIFGA